MLVSKGKEPFSEWSPSGQFHQTFLGENFATIGVNYGEKSFV
jgi:hypothetical protein